MVVGNNRTEENDFAIVQSRRICNPMIYFCFALEHDDYTTMNILKMTDYPFSIFSVSSVFLNSLLFCVISTVLWGGATSICDGIIIGPATTITSHYDSFCSTIIFHDTQMCESQYSRKIEAFEGLNRAMVDQKIFHVRWEKRRK